MNHFLKNILNEIEYAIGHYEPLDYSKVSTPYPPSENHFTKQVLIQDHFFEPTEMTDSSKPGYIGAAASW